MITGSARSQLRGRVASFLNFEPVNPETMITVEGSCLQNFIILGKLHLFHKEINDNIITITMEVAWPSGLGAGFVIRRS